MERNLSITKALGHFLACIFILILSSASAHAATKIYTCSINTAASTVYWSGGIAGDSGVMSVSGTFQEVITDGVIEFRQVNLYPSDYMTARIIPSYQGAVAQTGSSYSFSGSKPYDNSTGGGNFSGSINGTSCTLSGNFNAPCCDQYDYEFYLSGNAIPGVDTDNNNFTIVDAGGGTIAGSNDVHFAWDRTLKTSVAASGQVSNATISTSCLFFGQTMLVHDVAVYGPGTYTVYTGCAAGSPGCGAGLPVTFTVNGNEIGGHMLYDWNLSTNYDIVNVWRPKAVFGPSTLWTGACGANPADKVWDWMSNDADGDGINGIWIEGEGCSFDCPSLNFNLMETTNCNDGNACTNDDWDPISGCVHTPVTCNDSNACTTDSCDPATGCVYTVINCDDNNACTLDFCGVSTGCYYTPINCDDGSVCTMDSCNPAAGCVFTLVDCNDHNLCTDDWCDPATGCNHAEIMCNIGICNPATGICENLCLQCPPCADCDPAVGICGPCCPEGSVKSVTIRGGGQKPTTVDRQIRTQFTVTNDGCIDDWTASSVSCTPGTTLIVNVKAGDGPMPTNCTWNGSAIPSDYHLTIVCPDAGGTVGRLICDNKDGGGKDSDRITISVK